MRSRGRAELTERIILRTDRSGGSDGPPKYRNAPGHITLDLLGRDVLADARRGRGAVPVALVHGTEQGVPLVHPRAEPQEPAAEAREGVEHERDARVVFRTHAEAPEAQLHDAEGRDDGHED